MPTGTKTNNSAWTTNHADLNVGGQLDASNRLRVSQITNLLDIKQQNDNQPLFWDRENIGGAFQEYITSNGGVDMQVVSDGDAAICQSKMFAPYFSGKSQIFELAFDELQPQDDVIKRVGYFSSNTTTPFDSNKDGIWLESSGGSYWLVIEKNGVEVFRKSREQWNNGLDEINLNLFNIFVGQFLYLGGTSVTFSFIYKGPINEAHRYDHAGVKHGTFISSPNQPLRYEIRSTGGAGNMVQICGQVASEGSVDEIGVNRALDSDALSATTSGTEYAIMGIRLKSAYRDIRSELRNIDFLSTSNAEFLWNIWMNPTVSGMFTFSDVENSSVQLAKGATANVITGDGSILLSSGSGTGASSNPHPIRSSLRMGQKINGTMDEIVVTVTPLANNQTVYCSLVIQEFT